MPADDSLTWTTSRCNRLLRPISSRITTLRKESETQQRVARDPRNGSGFAKRASPQKANFAQSSNTRRPRGFDKAGDPDWVPGAKPQAVVTKRTYGGRPKKTITYEPKQAVNPNISRPGEIAFTPLIARTGCFLQSPNPIGSPLRQKKQGSLIAKMRQVKDLKKELRPDIGKLIEGLLDAYAKLLQATQTPQAKRRKGARSLRDICLQKLPAYIELEEYFAELDKEEAEEEDERDVSNEIYTHLEERFGARTGQGWQSFRNVVRAHGTALLCDAFADELLGFGALHAVIDLCTKLSAWDEAEKLLWTVLPILKPLPSPTSLQTDLFCIETSGFMHIAKHFVELTGRYGLLYDLLEHLISQELMPLEWLATESMRSFWGPLVRVISEEDPRTSGHAFRFLETAIYAGMGLPDDSVFGDGEIDIVAKQTLPSSRQALRDALDTTFSSLLTVLTSIAFVSHNQAENADLETAQRVSWTLNCLVIGLSKRKDIRADLELLDATTENMQTFAQRALWVVFSSLLLRLDGCSMTTGMIDLDASALVQCINWVLHTYSCHDIDIASLLATLPQAVCSAARCTGKAWQDDGFDQLQRLVDGLLSIRGLRLPHKLWNFKRLALDSCLEFANKLEHLAYARQIEAAMKMQGRVLMHSPQKDESPATGNGGFRWEEGIGEWVACTPFARQEVKRHPRSSIRPLDLLPTPAPSESSQATLIDEDMLPQDREDKLTWDQDVTFFSDAEPQSSPVKRRVSCPAARKRRCDSPMVVIPAKRTKLSLPSRNSRNNHPEYLYFSDCSGIESDPMPQCNLRRSRRPRNNVQKLRQTRSRASLTNSLRKMAPKKYYEVTLTSESDSDLNDKDELNKTPAVMKQQNGANKRGRGQPRKRGQPNWLISAAVGGGAESEDELSFH